MEPSAETLSQITSYLSTKRKPRDLKACYPCRQRKVKCSITSESSDSPCEGCVKRGHPEICMMLGPSKRGRTETPELRAITPMMQLDALLGKVTALECTISSLRNDLTKLRAETRIPQPTIPKSREQSYLSSPISPPDPTPVRHCSRLDSPSTTSAAFPLQTSPPLRSQAPSGIHAPDSLTGSTVYLGPTSAPAIFTDASTLSKNILQVFGLHNSQLTYPFANLWGPPRTSPASGDVELEDAAQVAKTLPNSSEILRFWKCYREDAWPFYPAIPDIDSFEAELCDFIQDRDDGRTDPTCGRGAGWLGLLFAVLASGIQFFTTPMEERELSSRVYVCCSFQLLRHSNFFIHPTTTQIQTLLLIGNCIRNDTNPGSAWILLGITIRLAQSIGLHRATEGEEAKLWWAIVWQDTLLSFSYDRPSGATGGDLVILGTDGGVRSFSESIYELCCIIRDLTNARSTTGSIDAMSMETILGYKSQLETLLYSASSPLRTRQARLEALGLRIHIGYVISQLCHYTLRRPPPTISNSERTLLEEQVVQRPADVVRAFLDMMRLAPAVCRSWAFMHNALSCALLLRIFVGEGKFSPERKEVAGVLERLVACLSEAEGGRGYAVALQALREKPVVDPSRIETRKDLPELDRSETDCAGQQPGMLGSSAGSGYATPVETMGGDGAGQAYMREDFMDALEPDRILESIIWGGRRGDDFGAYGI
ncbi:hypothetical protein BJ508DRAFT_239883 [Ascobolus immersus RN42]|uniref:Zn(2)-C6 fungal-type domain-containing protein n=1 Tax=Ascobolus immersus RN42 TaxID=1160509 RepID=A0A3N4I3G6_ASCIM|nr:hypothetical protein BJ508DRAFT_239883 [Ascobolus immersus RN42]